MMIISGKKYLLDTNILVYSQDKKSAKHKRTLEIIDDLEEKASTIFLTVQNLLEYSAVFSRHFKISKKEIAKDLDLFSQRANLRVLYPNEAVFKSFISLMNSEPKIRPLTKQIKIFGNFLFGYFEMSGKN